MTCIEVNQRLGPFLEDSLTEEEYQAIWEHVKGCETCKQATESVSTLANQIHKLSTVNMPSDLESTILFRVKHPSSVQPEIPQPKKTGNKALVVMIAILTISAGVFVWKYAQNKAEAKKRDARSASLATGTESPIKNERKQKDFVDVTPVVAGASASSENGQAEQLVKEFFGIEQPAPVERTAEKQPSPNEAPQVPEWIPFHVRYSGSKARSQLLDTIGILGIQQRYEAPDLLVLSATARQIRELNQNLPSIARALPLSDLGLGALKSGEYGISMSLEDESSGGSQTAYWHITIEPAMQDWLHQQLDERKIQIRHSSKGVLILEAEPQALEGLRSALASRAGVRHDFSIGNAPPADQTRRVVMHVSFRS